MSRSTIKVELKTIKCDHPDCEFEVEETIAGGVDESRISQCCLCRRDACVSHRRTVRMSFKIEDPPYPPQWVGPQRSPIVSVDLVDYLCFNCASSVTKSFYLYPNIGYEGMMKRSRPRLKEALKSFLDPFFLDLASRPSKEDEEDE